MSWHRAGKADKTPHCIPETTTHNTTGETGLQSAISALRGGGVWQLGGDGELFRTPVASGL